MIAIHHIKKQGHFRIIVSAPVIYAMLVPIAFLDVSAQFYQAVCFRLFEIPFVDRRSYVRDSRRTIAGFSPFDRLNCWFCSYANGVMGFVREIFARTEQYWCPVRQRFAGRFVEPEHHANFAPHGDLAALKKTLTKNDAALQAPPSARG